MQKLADNMHSLTLSTINDLQRVFQNCSYSDEGLILSALVKVKTLQDLLPCLKSTCSDSNPDEVFPRGLIWL